MGCRLPAVFWMLSLGLSFLLVWASQGLGAVVVVETVVCDGSGLVSRASEDRRRPVRRRESEGSSIQQRRAFLAFVAAARLTRLWF